MDVVPATDQQVAEHVAAAERHTLVLLRAGPVRDQPEHESDRIQAGHLRHLVGLVQAGHLVVNGPVLDEGALRGVSIYRTPDVDQVRAWVQADPAVQAGRLRAEVHPWFGRLATLGDDLIGPGSPLA
jgi:uncharacterized protein YciI